MTAEWFKNIPEGSIVTWVGTAAQREYVAVKGKANYFRAVGILANQRKAFTASQLARKFEVNRFQNFQVLRLGER